MTLLNGIAAIIIGSTHAGSMGEHLISHYIDMFMGDKHPGSLHGEQVGVATLLLSRMQNDILNSSHPPQFSEINHDLTIFENIFGKDAGLIFINSFKINSSRKSLSLRLTKSYWRIGVVIKSP
jgi:glycerol-1-phosphate dehydrogenase [NAD(P)+]